MLAGKVLSAAGEGDSATIWDKWSAPKFRAAVSREKFEKAVVGLHQKLGAVRSKTRVGYHIKTDAGRTVHFRCDRSVDKSVFEPVMDAIAAAGGRISAVGEKAKRTKKKR